MRSKHILFSVLICSFLLSCNHEEFLEMPLPEVSSFVANCEGESGTKTVVANETQVLWMPGDRIQVFTQEGESAVFTSTNTEPEGSTVFTGNLEAESKAYIAIYPYREDNSFADGEPIITLPSEQIAIAGTFDNNLFPAVAVSSTTELHFKNLCGGVCFTVANEGITRVSIRSNNDEILTGKYRVKWNGGDPSLEYVEGGEREIVVNAPEGGFIPGEKYYAVIRPTVFGGKGVTIHFDTPEAYSEWGAAWYDVWNMSINRGIFSKAIDKDNAFVPYTPDGNVEFADPRVKSLLVKAFDTDYDGELSYAEAAAVTSAPALIEVLNGEKISSFNEFRFFTGIKYLDYVLLPDTDVSEISLPESLRWINARIVTGAKSLKKVSLGGTLAGSGHPLSFCFDGAPIESVIVSNSYGHYKLSSVFAHGESNLKTVVLDKGIEIIIEPSAFSLCPLESIDLPEGLSIIGEDAFLGCNHLKSIAIPKTVSVIGAGAFQDCTNIEGDIVIPEGVTSIEDRTFMNCSSITSITLPEGVTRIGEHAFKGCSSLTSIIIPESVTRIEHGAFENCSGLKSITMPKSMSYLGGSVFSECSSLISITIPEGVTRIEGSLFSDCGDLTSIILPDGVTDIGNYAFLRCYSLESIAVPNSVTTIGYAAFENCKSLTSFVIPDGVSSIEGWTFYGCSSLVSLTIPQSVKRFGDHAFGNCSCLTGSITVPDGTTTIGERTFSSCGRLTEIILPEGLKTIEDYAFYGVGIHSLSLPQSLEKIGAWAFASSQIESFHLPEGLAVLGEYAFHGGALNEAYIPGGITTLDHTFEYCYELENVILNEGLLSIGETAFLGCKLSSISIPKTVQSIGRCAFLGNVLLTNVIIEGSNSIDEKAFMGCKSLTQIQLPDNLVSIGMSAFEDCSSLSSITIPEQVTFIGYGTFKSTSMTTLTVLPLTPPVIGEDIYHSRILYINRDCKIYVPAASLLDYRHNVYWRQYYGDYGKQIYPIED